MNIERLKGIIREEIEKELLSSNNNNPMSRNGLELVKTSFLSIPYALVDAVVKVNSEKAYGYSEEQCKELVNFVIENIPELDALLSEEDYSREEDNLKHRSEIDKRNKKNLQRDKIQLQQKKLADKLRSI